MKYELPNNHGLSDSIIETLVFRDNDTFSLTDIQYESLKQGVGLGKSALVVAPTSTGKTHIALWAIAKGLENNRNTVYLVTHRALAKQKFDDFKNLILNSFLDGSAPDLVLATGDAVENADGDIPPSPLTSRLIVATYEKYLALLSASGVPSDLSNSVIVCDEIQLIGDKHRGQNVEVLLTLIRSAKWNQFVGLSAVLKNRDAQNLANWLDVTLVNKSTREKHLQYECWSPNGIAIVSTKDPETIQEGYAIPPDISCDPLSILNALLRQEEPPMPIIIFCMRKSDVYDLANKFISDYCKEKKQKQLSLAFDGFPETNATDELPKMFSRGIGIHSADLTDEERHVVEVHLSGSQLDAVFATSTLAAGVNYPLGAAIFSKWTRWSFDRRQYVPIETDEFHNMAGRVGRMGFQHEQGRVIFTANSAQLLQAKQYLKLDALPTIKPRIDPKRFNQLALQLVSSGLCTSKADIKGLVCETFSALIEKDENLNSYERWPIELSEAVDGLVDEGLLIQTVAGNLTATPVGKAIGYSGLLPETGIYILNYVAKKVENLICLLPQSINSGDLSRLAFLVFCSCFCSPEFRPRNGKPATRILPYPLNDYNFDASLYNDDLPESPWIADPLPINAAKLCLDWINGTELRTLEKYENNLSAGMILEMCRNLIWALRGMASIITAAADEKVPVDARPKALRVYSTDLNRLGRLPRVVHRLSFRVLEGLPDEVLWMNELNSVELDFHLSRSEILALKSQNVISPEHVMQGSPEFDKGRKAAFIHTNAKPSAQQKANRLRDICRNWKKRQREKVAEKHIRRAKQCFNVDIISSFYKSKGKEFEKIFERILGLFDISYDKLDDNKKPGAPDYLVYLLDSSPLVIELKSKDGDDLIDYNKAVKVLASSEIYGHSDKFCVTLCHPGVDPSVPMLITACGRLSVVESIDIGEAFIRLCEGTLTQRQLWQWLASPGQALISDLPYRNYN